MRKLLGTVAALTLLAVSIPAMAADLPLKAPPPAPPPFSWTGFYVGANGGFAWGQGDVTDTLLALDWGNRGGDGFLLAGGEAGFNYQMGNFVVGVEGDYDWASNIHNGANLALATPIGPLQVTTNNKWVSTLAARFGWAFDKWLGYVKAGGGWVGNDGFTIVNTATGAAFTGSNSNTQSGWLVGAGIEWAIANNWTLKVEYDYLGLNTRTFTVPPTAPFLIGDTFTTGNHDVQMVKVGLNYLFNWGGPVVARY